MKPLSLEIKGLNSFAEQQNIDFEALTQYGIFGIFGPTGSGKSTIIDAMTLALYDKIPRIQNERTIKQCINLNCEEMFVSYTFEIIDVTPKRYTVERGYKKTATAYRSYISRMYCEGNVLAERPDEVTAKVGEIIGLSYDDFVRSVVLPQGKFSEFLFLANKERRAMLERIFRLEQYGEELSRKVRKKYSDYKYQLALTMSQLEMLGNITEADILSEKETLAVAEKELEVLKKSLSSMTAEQEVLKKTKELHDEYNACANNIKGILSRSEEMELNRSAVKKSERAEKVVPLIAQNNALKIKLSQISELKGKHEASYTKAEKEYADAKAAHGHALTLKEEKHEGLIKRSASLEEGIRLLSALKQTNKELAALTEKYIAVKKNHDEILKKLTELEEEISKNTAELFKTEERKKALYVDSAYRLKLERCVETEKKCAELSAEIDKLTLKCNERSLAHEKNLAAINALSAETAKTDAFISALKSHVIRLIEGEVATLIQDINAAELEINQLEATAERMKDKLLIQDLAKNLVDGQPCILCGSTTHPQPCPRIENDEATAINATIKSTKGHITFLKEKLRDRNTELTAADKTFQTPTTTSDVANFDFDLEEGRKQIKTELERLNTLKIEEASLKAKFSAEKNLLEETTALLNEKVVLLTKTNETWEADKKSFQLESFSDTMASIKKRDEEFELLVKTEEGLRTTKETLIKQNDSYKLELGKLSETMAAIKAEGKGRREEANNRQKELDQLNCGDQPEKELNIVRQSAEMLITTEKKTKLELESAEKEKNQSYENLVSCTKEYEAANGVKQQLDADLAKALEENGFNNALEAEKSILSNKKHIEEAVSKHDDELKAAQSNMDRLKHSIGGRDLEKINERVSENNQLIERTSDHISEKTKASAVRGQKILQMEADFKKIEVLFEKKQEQEKCLDIFEDMSKLFAGNLFVEYIAKRQLANIASETSRRLGQMTGGRYALELDDTDFVIRDDFNGGIRRSPKTLSGGETFLVSLCLALALSLNVQLKGNAPLQLFFLDEGFGTLDPSLVDVVTETLERLKSQKLHVGLITHVEELKSRIPAKLTVIPALQGVHGTKVEMSF